MTAAAPERRGGNDDNNGIWEFIYALDKRVALIERDMVTLTTTLQTILVKIESLPEKIMLQQKEFIHNEIKMHDLNCSVKAQQNEKPKDEGEVKKTNALLEWLLRNIVQIIIIVALIVANHYNVKVTP